MLGDPRGVLITRPRVAAEALAAELAVKGWTPLIEPLLEIVTLPTMLPDLTAYQGLIFTSANGVTAFAAKTGRRDGPVYVVGDATAAQAQAAGFSDIRIAAGDGAALNRLLAAEKPAGPLLHAGGVHRATDIGAPDVGVDHIVLYEARAVAALSPACRDALAQGTLAAALFFSPRTGEVFTKRLEESGQTALVSPIQALCLSNSVLKSITSLGWASVQVASHPDKAGMLALLDRISS